jgi:hypothetical protein
MHAAMPPALGRRLLFYDCTGPHWKTEGAAFPTLLSDRVPRGTTVHGSPFLQCMELASTGLRIG